MHVFGYIMIIFLQSLKENNETHTAAHLYGEKHSST